MTRTRIHPSRAIRFAGVLGAAVALGWSATSASAAGFPAPDARPAAHSPAAPRPEGSCPIRVQFASGTDSATINGSISDGVCDRYVLRLGAGQTMTLTNIGTLHVSVTAPDGSTLPGGPGDTISYQLPATGDYVVEVNPGMSEQDTYSITITVPPLGTSSAQRIQFAAGTDNATVQDSIAPGTTARYVLRAGAGQTMTVDVGPSEFAALTTIFGPDGSVVGAGHTTATATLPVDGDYIVEVGNTGTTTDFTLTVRVTG